jgi:hypothetical protein
LEWAAPAPESPLEVVPLHKVAPAGAGLTIALPVVERVFGDAPYDDLVALCSLVRARAPRRIFEFGTHTGATTLQMMANAPADARLWTLDLPPAQRSVTERLNQWDQAVDDAIIGSHFRDTAYAGRITQLYDDSRSFDPEPFRGTMDFVFVDACHDYEFVVNDTRKAFEMLAPGGAIVWHDYPGFEGVRRCLHETARDHRLVQIQGTILAAYGLEA